MGESSIAANGRVDRSVSGGLGQCPNWMRIGPWKNNSTTEICGCGAPKCAICGFPKHSGIHMHKAEGQPGDAPWGHEYQAPNV